MQESQRIPESIPEIDFDTENSVKSRDFPSNYREKSSPFAYLSRKSALF